MNRRTFVLSGATLVSTLSAQTRTSRLIVNVNYTGSGAVDESHKVYVVLWGDAEFIKGASSTPIAIKSVTSKSASADFDGIDKNPVFVSMVYDPTGKWDAMSPPPAGSSLGLYSTEPGTPAPIKLEPAKPTTITAKFDDSSKMQ